MARRKIIKIDEKKCNGCGRCIPNCPEGALQVIDGKARLISDLFCDGLGACIGHCPEGAITIEEREAQPYDERRVMKNIVRQGENVIKAHLDHLRKHNEMVYLKQATEFLKENNIGIPSGVEYKSTTGGTPQEGDTEQKSLSACPGSRMFDFSETGEPEGQEKGRRASQLRQWPVQLRLVQPSAPYFRDRDIILAADCIAYTLADFHKDYLRGKSLAIACPKLDESQEAYIEKITALIDEARINTLTVMTMEVPCCGGLLLLARKGAERASRCVPIKHIVVSIRGEILKEEWCGQPADKE